MENEARNDEQLREKSWLKASAADLAFIVCVIVVSGVVGIAFESTLIVGLLMVIGGMFAWAVWREFRHRVLNGRKPNRHG